LDTFPAVFAVFAGNYQRNERSVPQESSIVTGMTIEITARQNPMAATPDDPRSMQCKQGNYAIVITVHKASRIPSEGDDIRSVVSSELIATIGLARAAAGSELPLWWGRRLARSRSAALIAIL
jgi:hypothetical protein